MTCQRRSKDESLGSCVINRLSLSHSFLAVFIHFCCPSSQRLQETDSIACNEKSTRTREETERERKTKEGGMEGPAHKERKRNEKK